MGRIIAKRIRGMNWMAKVSLVLIFTLVLSTFMHQGWYKPKFTEAAATANGTIVYNNNNVNPPVYRNYAVGTNTFVAAANLPAGATNQAFFVNKASKTRSENIAGYVTTGGALYILRWNGSAWSAEWGPITVGGTGINGRRFDIAYEQTSGNAMVVYSNNTTGANELRYNVWNGSAWSGAQTLDAANITGTPAWIKMASRSTAGSNELAATVMDTNGLLTTLRWNGTDWTTLAESSEHTGGLFLLRSATYGDYDNFDTAYEGLTGNLMVVWTQTGPAQYWRTCAAGGAWNAATATGTARTTDVTFLAADPNSNNMVAGWFRSGSTNVYGMAWDGSAWGAATVIGTLGAAYTTAVNKHRMTAGWATAGGATAALVAWNNSSQLSRVDYNTFTVGTGWGTATSYTTAAAGIKAWMDMDRDPLSGDTLMLTFSDANNDLWAKRFVYNGSAFTGTQADGGAALTATLGTVNTNKNFDFEYTIPQQLTIGEGTNPADHNAARSDTNQSLDGFTMKMNFGTGTVTSLTVTGDTNFTSTNIPTNGVKVWRDTGTTVGAWDAGDTPVSTASTAIAGNATTVTISSEAVTSTAVNYIVTVDITAGATIGNTFTATISNAGGTGLGTPVDNDASAATLTIVTPTLTVGNGTNPIDAIAQQNSTNNSLDGFTLVMNGGTGTVTSLTVTGSANFTSTNIPTNGVKVWRDTGTTVGKWDTGDIQVSTASTAISGNATTVTISSESVTSTAKDYVVTVNINPGATLTQAFTGTVTAASGTGLGTPTYSDTTSATLTINKLPSTITSCAGCHSYTSLFPDGTTRNNPEGAFVGNHNAHAVKYGALCSVCHVVPATETSVNFGHRDGNITMQANISGGSYSKASPIAQVNNPTTGTCSNISCHGGNNPTPQWGVGTANCVTCHNGVINRTKASGTLSNVVAEFSLLWGHKKSGRGAVTDADCIVCHLEGNYTTQKMSAYHADGNIDLRAPDGAGETRITNIAGASYTFQKFATSYAAGSRTSTGHQAENVDNIITQKFCLACHDSNGATNPTARTSGGTAAMPFGGINLGGTYTTANGAMAAGGLIDVKTQTATTNSSFHPIQGPKFKGYPTPSIMTAPYDNYTRTAGTKSNGVVMNCFDCHNTPTTALTTRTVAAHGNAATLRGTVYVASPTLCTICHSLANYGGAGDMHVAGTAFDNNADGHGHSMSTCHNCHASAVSNPARPIRAADYHGYNKLLSGANWPTRNSRPFAFIRNTVNYVYHNPAQTADYTGTASCRGVVGGPCITNGDMELNQTYAPGGQY